jgi:threonine dehydrogenase-like Zn-dependent dehydrogenase
MNFQSRPDPAETGMLGAMTAATLTGPRRFELQRLPQAMPGRGEVRVRLEGCGVCASNVLPWTGPEWMRFPAPPGNLGHDGWGIIDAVGAEVEGLREGDRVATLFYNSYATHDVGPATQVLQLPDELQHIPFPGEPLGCAVNVIERSDIRPGQVVIVVGLGFMGLLLVRLAALEGARVIALARSDDALERARTLGASDTVRLQSMDQAVADVAALTSGAFAPRVIEATGHAEPLDLAAKLVATRGRLIVAGYHQDGPRYVDMQSWNWRGIDVINAHERDPAIYMDGMRKAIELVADGRLDPRSLYTHVLPFDRLNEALELAEKRPAGFVKALVMMS